MVSMAKGSVPATTMWLLPRVCVNGRRPGDTGGLFAGDWIGEGMGEIIEAAEVSLACRLGVDSERMPTDAPAEER